jgi:RND superfamily putative drug exporter
VFARLGRWCYRRRLATAALWLIVLVLLGAAAGSLGSKSRSEFTLPDVESRRGVAILEDNFGGMGTGPQGTIVFRAEAGVGAPQVRGPMQRFFERVDAIPGVSVTSPYATGAAHQIAAQGPDAGRIAYATVELPGEATLEDAHRVKARIERLMPHLPGVQIELGGQAFADFEPPSSELLGLAFAIFILIVSFGSVLAMGLPIGVALAGIGVGISLVTLLGHVVTMPAFATAFGVMLGLGAGIDYALFIVTRFRENLRAGKTIEDATAVALDTAGRAVTFAGTTVVISLLGMLIMQISFVTGLAVGMATVVAVTIVASLTLLPALVGFVGPRIEVTRWRGAIAATLTAAALVGAGLRVDALLVGVPLAVVVLLAGFAVAPLRREVPRRPPKPAHQTLPFKWSRFIQRHPWPAALTGAAVLGVLALPLFGLRLGFSDEGNYPTNTTTRRAYDLLARGFGPGFNGPLLLVTTVPPGKAGDLDRITAALGRVDGVAFASPAIPNDPARPTAAMWRVIPTTAPQDAATTDLVYRLRNDVLPPLERDTGLDVAVAGSVAIQVDFTRYLATRTPWFFAAVLTLSFLLLMAVFRSLLVPLKAVVMNLLSIGAAYGVVVVVFQWGWGASLLGIAGGPIEPFIPMMLFAIVFGLSMDYEVFLLSRVKEEWDRTGDSHTSVADGLAATGRVITAAAAIMVVVFGSFLLESERVIKLMGTGLAVAVALDATIVRMLLVPATMELLGDRNWWLPRWLGRVLPAIDVEGHPGHPGHLDAELARELSGKRLDAARHPGP